MKIIKLSLIKKQENLSKACNQIAIKIKCKGNKNTIELGNLIRRGLLKDTVRLEAVNNAKKIN